PYDVGPDAVVLDVVDVRRGTATLPDGPVVVYDPIGGPIGVALAEELGDRAVLVTQDHIAGNELARTGDLAPANVRLQQRRVRIERRTLLRAVRAGEVELEDRFTGQHPTLTCGRATASRLARCTRRCSRDGGPLATWTSSADARVGWRPSSP